MEYNTGPAVIECLVAGFVYWFGEGDRADVKFFLYLCRLIGITSKYNHTTYPYEIQYIKQDTVAAAVGSQQGGEQ